MDDKRFHIERRVGKIGFMGKGGRMPARRGEPDAPRAIRLRIGDDRISTSPEDLEAARFDLTVLPDPLARIFSKAPEAVVRPQTAQEAAEAVNICFEERSPVVPRGAASSFLGGAVPVRGGIVMDLTGLNGLADIDRERGTATAQAGTVWSDLMEALEREGYAPACYPTSAGKSTVGGWVSSGGYGAGTLRRGSFHAQIASLEIALASGFLVEATGQEGRYSIPSFAGTEGQLGVVTKATFTITRAPQKRVTLVAGLEDTGQGVRILEALAALETPPHTAEFASSGAARLYGAGWDRPVMIVLGAGEAPEVDKLVHEVKGLLAGSGSVLDTSLDARDLWAARLSGLLEEREKGPYMSAGLVFASADLERFVSYITERCVREANLFFECLAVERGRTLVTAGYRAGFGGEVSPLKALARVRGMAAAGAGMGGVPYGVGLWNSPYIDVILGKRKKELRRIKGEVDRLRIMNPGKFFSMTTRSGLRVPGWAMRAYFGIAGR